MKNIKHQNPAVKLLALICAAPLSVLILRRFRVCWVGHLEGDVTAWEEPLSYQNPQRGNVILHRPGYYRVLRLMHIPWKWRNDVWMAAGNEANIEASRLASSPLLDTTFGKEKAILYGSINRE